MKYHKKVLENGLRIITVPMQESQTAMVMIMVETGSEYEDKKINGLSHFLEHMCFKGTKKRTGRELSYELDALGAQNNAFTGETYTGYYAKARFKKVKQILDIISDMYLNPTFPEEDIEIERGVILEEINMYKDMHAVCAAELYNELLFGDQPAGRKIIGTEKNIKAFQRSDFVKYHQDHYVPQKTTVIISGNINEKEIIKEVTKRFGALEKGKVIKKPKIKFNQKYSKVKINNKKIDQTHMVLGFRAFDIYDKRNVALDVATTVLGRGMSSRLFVKMRDELGLCYYVRALLENSIDRGDFVVTIGVSNKKAVEATKALIEEFRKLRDEPILEKELKKAKDIVLGSLANGLETSDAWARFYGVQELHHEKIETPAEYAKKVRAVTVKDIQKVLKQVIKNDGLNLAIVGPQNDAKKFKKVLRV